MKNIQKILCVLLCSFFVGGVARGMDALLDAVNDEDSEQIKKLLEDTPPEERVELVNTIVPAESMYCFFGNAKITLIMYAFGYRPWIAKHLVDIIPKEKRFELFMRFEIYKCILPWMIDKETENKFYSIRYLIESIPKKEDRHSFIELLIKEPEFFRVYDNYKLHQISLELIAYILEHADDDSEKILWIKNSNLVKHVIRMDDLSLFLFLLNQAPKGRILEISKPEASLFEYIYTHITKHDLFTPDSFEAQKEWLVSQCDKITYRDMGRKHSENLRNLDAINIRDIIINFLDNQEFWDNYRTYLGLCMHNEQDK